MNKKGINSFLRPFLMAMLFTSVVGAQNPTTAEGWNALGFQQNKNKEYAKAEASYGECIRLNAAAGNCFSGRAIARFYGQKYDLSVADLTKAIELSPKVSANFGIRGDAYLRMGRAKNAIADYSQAIAIEPRDIYYVARGTAKAADGDHQGATIDLSEAIRLNPNYALAYDKRADSYAALKKFDLALIDRSKVVALAPNDARSYFERGLTYEKLKRYQESVNDLTQAITLDPKNAWAHNGRAYSYELMGKTAEAEAGYSKAIELSPTTAMFYRNRGNLYYGLKQDAKAEADLKKAIEIDPKFAWAFNNLGNLYLRQKKNVEAVDNFSRATAIDPKYTTAFYNRGLAHRNMGNYDQAIQDLSKAIELDPGYVKAYKERSDALARLKKFDESLKDAMKLVELEPNNADQWVNRGAAYDRAGKKDLALADYKKALAMDPKHHVAHFNIGSYHYNRDEFDDALAALNRSLTIKPDYAEAVRARAITYCKKGDMVRATADEKKAKELGREVAKPCASEASTATTSPEQPAAASNYDLAYKEFLARRFNEAVGLIEKHLAATTVPASKRASDSIDMAGKLVNAGQTELAQKLFEKIALAGGIPVENRTRAILATGNFYFGNKNFVKAREFYSMIPGSLDARTNMIKAFHQEKDHKNAAEWTASTMSLLAQHFYASRTAAEKKSRLEAANNFFRDAVGLADEYGKAPATKPSAFTILRALERIMPAGSPDANLVKERIAKLEGAGN
ncbi:MAG: tetratricopeptide repeat protein [Pyrinomonadaceae bacterium]